MPEPARSRPNLGNLTLLTEGDELAHLVQGLKAQRAWAQRALLEDHGRYVERVITRVVGYHPELEDLVQEVFIRALSRLDQLQDASGLRPWLGAFAVFVAREAIRKRRRWRWIVFAAPEELPEQAAPTASPAVLGALRAFYALLDRMDVELRIAFALRVVDGMELTEIAELTDVSLATVKRRLSRAQTWFQGQAAKDSRLADWVGAAV